jgi:rare lipoprotein A
VRIRRIILNTFSFSNSTLNGLKSLTCHDALRMLFKARMQTQTVCKTRQRHGRLTTAFLLLATVAGTTAYASAGAHAPESPGKKLERWFQVGKATWYGRKFQGHRTASGEPFDLNMLTCAHRTLPIGTLLRVTNLVNRRSVMVRVNDRGPVQKGLVVDLSYAAARSLGVAASGTLHVRLERVEGAEAAQLNWPSLGQPPGLRQPIAGTW